MNVYIKQMLRTVSESLHIAPNRSVFKIVPVLNWRWFQIYFLLFDYSVWLWFSTKFSLLNFNNCIQTLLLLTELALIVSSPLTCPVHLMVHSDGDPTKSSVINNLDWMVWTTQAEICLCECVSEKFTSFLWSVPASSLSLQLAQSARFLSRQQNPLSMKKKCQLALLKCISFAYLLKEGNLSPGSSGTNGLKHKHLFVIGEAERSY